MPRPHEHEPRDVTGAERPVAVAFSPSKNNSHEHHQRHASNWNQLSKLPAGSRFRSVCEPFWERAIKNSEQLKAEPLPQVLHVPRVAMESLVCQSRRFLLLVVGRLRTRTGGVLGAGAAPCCLLCAHSTGSTGARGYGSGMGGGGGSHATAPPARAHSGGLFQHFPQLAASTFGLELAGGAQRELGPHPGWSTAGQGQAVPGGFDGATSYRGMGSAPSIPHGLQSAPRGCSEQRQEDTRCPGSSTPSPCSPWAAPGGCSVPRLCVACWPCPQPARISSHSPNKSNWGHRRVPGAPPMAAPLALVSSPLRSRCSVLIP